MEVDAHLFFFGFLKINKHINQEEVTPLCSPDNVEGEAAAGVRGNDMADGSAGSGGMSQPGRLMKFIYSHKKKVTMAFGAVHLPTKRGCGALG